MRAMLNYKWYFFLLGVLSCGCSGNSSSEVEKEKTVLLDNHLGTEANELNDTLPVYLILNQNPQATIKDQPLPTVLVLPSANGYDYSISNKNIDDILKKGLKSSTHIELVPFPYKTLMDTHYLGVFDKKLCPAIAEKVKADYVLMSYQYGSIITAYEEEKELWGYHLKFYKTSDSSVITPHIIKKGIPTFKKMKEVLYEEIELIKLHQN